MTDHSKAAGQQERNPLEQIDDLLSGSTPLDIERIEQKMTELRRFLSHRDRWLLVERVAQVFELLPWLEGVQIEHDSDDNAMYVQEWAPEGVRIDHAALLTFMKQMGEVAPEQEQARIRIERGCEAGNEESLHYAARREARSEMECLPWNVLGQAWMAASARLDIPRGSREQIARLLLRGQPLASWEALRLKAELAADEAAQSAAAPEGLDGEAKSAKNARSHRL